MNIRQLHSQIKVAVSNALDGEEVRSCDVVASFIDLNGELVREYSEELARMAIGRIIQEQLKKAADSSEKESGQQQLFDGIDLPAALTFERDGQVIYIARRKARRFHYEAQIEYLNRLIDADIGKRNVLVVANHRLELLRKQHGDLPEAELVAAASTALTPELTHA